jgi:chromosome segregation ATPase
VESAAKAVEENIFSNELIQKFNDLRAAIRIEETRLQELYGIGNELQKLVLAIEGGRERITEIENEKSSKEEAAQISIKKLREDYSQKNAELQAEYDAHAKKIKTERERESEEYKYNLTRSREKENNSWTDEKNARETELKKRENQTAELLFEAEEKTEYILSLEEKVKTIPEYVTAEKETAVKTAVDALTKEHEHQCELFEMERKNAVARLEDRVKYLEKEIANAVKSNEILQGKLDKAYSEMRELAAKTVESATSIKLISSPKEV